MYKKAINTKTDEDWNRFKTRRNEVVTLIRNQKKAYYTQKIDETKHDPAEMWKTLKQLNEKEISEQFNDYFIDSIDNIALSLTKTNNYDYILDNMKSHNAAFAVGEVFLNVINSSLDSGTFPKTWKKSTIVPVEKKNNTILAEEHRPLNMVPSYEKLLETVVNEQLMEYCESNNLLTKYQSGFRKNNSCESALQTVLFHWQEAINNKSIIGAVFIDFQRAFETIDRDLLILKLGRFGIGNTVIEWFRNIHEYSTRNRNDFYVQTVRTNYSQNSLYHKGLIMYNNLPNEVKLAQNIHTFKLLCNRYSVYTGSASFLLLFLRKIDKPNFKCFAGYNELNICDVGNQEIHSTYTSFLLQEE
ncbi:hypothetical protein NQ317_001513 [Molorchus minor]|uniref:Reverse transcriptase domain-containing protein n=1 Tax=Molorchus minor TaxID=1323400 RepID=A0ABQ9JVS9_9CUCU|nr:hypothetical protein NQ317_001513 [Molorchus minor]